MMDKVKRFIRTAVYPDMLDVQQRCAQITDEDSLLVPLFMQGLHDGPVGNNIWKKENQPCTPNSL